MLVSRCVHNIVTELLNQIFFIYIYIYVYTNYYKNRLNELKITHKVNNQFHIKLELSAFALKSEHSIYSLVPNIHVCIYIDQK